MVKYRLDLLHKSSLAIKTSLTKANEMVLSQDVYYYIETYKDIIPEGMHPCIHYINIGLVEGLIPTHSIKKDALLNTLYLKNSLTNIKDVQNFIEYNTIEDYGYVDYKFYNTLYNDIDVLVKMKLNSTT